MIFSGEQEAEKIMTLLDRPTDSEYQREEAQRIKLTILTETKDEEEVEAFIEQNITNPSLRKIAIENALGKKDFEKAISIARDGIRHDEKEKPGLANEWYDWLLRIALKQKDKERIIEYARLLFVDSIRDKRDYYAIMKSHVDPAQWRGFVEGMVSDITKRKRWLDVDFLAWIFIQEGWWERLLDLISRSPSLHQIQHYEEHLADRYPEELTDLYEKGILKQMEQSTGRKHYQEACRYLRRMKKLGAGKKVNEAEAQLPCSLKSVS